MTVILVEKFFTDVSVLYVMLNIFPLHVHFFIFYLYVIQHSVKKILHCISLEYLMAALVSNFLSPGALCVTRVRDKLLQQVHGWRKH